MKDYDLGMKNKLTHKLGSVSKLMNNGCTGPKDVVNPMADVKALMNNGGKGPKAVYKSPGKTGVKRLMNQR
jgi:hypothetical protein